MSARAGRPEWTPGRGLLVTVFFLAAFTLGGVWVGPMGVEYRVFGLVDGLAALLIVYALVRVNALARPVRVWGTLALAYALGAAAQLVALLLPPPGVLEWLVLLVILYFAWNAGPGGHRDRVVLGLGLGALALAALNYSLLPHLWMRTQLPETPIIDLRALGEGVKGLVVVYEPSRPVTQLFAFAAVLSWALGLWAQWPREDREDWLRRLSRADRDRLLFGLLRDRLEARQVDEDEVRGYLEGSHEPRS